MAAAGTGAGQPRRHQPDSSAAISASSNPGALSAASAVAAASSPSRIDQPRLASRLLLLHCRHATLQHLGAARHRDDPQLFGQNAPPSACPRVQSMHLGCRREASDGPVPPQGGRAVGDAATTADAQATGGNGAANTASSQRNADATQSARCSARVASRSGAWPTKFLAASRRWHS
jgi:hypothetical protein